MCFDRLVSLAVKVGLVVCLLGSWSPCVGSPITFDKTGAGVGHEIFGLPAGDDELCMGEPNALIEFDDLPVRTRPSDRPAASPAVTSVPEPATLLLSAVGIVYLWRRPRRI